MKNLNPLYENLISPSKKIITGGIKRTINNRKKIKKYLIRKMDEYKDKKDSDED